MLLEVQESADHRLVEVPRSVLKQNDVIARALREQFRAGRGVFVLVSSPGSGKTTFLEKTLSQLQPRYRVAALVGDLATENDAVRLARSKVPVKQITTGTFSHLEAARWCRVRCRSGTCINWIFCGSRTWGIWFVRLSMISGRTCDWC